MWKIYETHCSIGQRPWQLSMSVNADVWEWKWFSACTCLHWNQVKDDITCSPCLFLPMNDWTNWTALPPPHHGYKPFMKHQKSSVTTLHVCRWYTHDNLKKHTSLCIVNTLLQKNPVRHYFILVVCVLWANFIDYFKSWQIFT